MGAFKLDDQLGTLLEFPTNKNFTNSTTITSEMLNEFLASGVDDEQIKSILESYFFERLVNVNTITLEHSPFDAIFISDLSADVLNPASFANLEELKNKVQDLSDTIIFNDGLDD